MCLCVYTVSDVSVCDRLCSPRGRILLILTRSLCFCSLIPPHPPLDSPKLTPLRPTALITHFSISLSFFLSHTHNNSYRERDRCTERQNHNLYIIMHHYMSKMILSLTIHSYKIMGRSAEWAYHKSGLEIMGTMEGSPVLLNLVRWQLYAGRSY